MPQLIHNTSAPKLWFGTEESFDAVISAAAQLSKLEAAGVDALKAAVIARGGGTGDDPFGLPPLHQVQEGVGILRINGSLVSGHSGFMRLFGIVGYGDIQESLAALAADQSVNTILLSIDSGGGHVNGVEDTGNMVQAVDRKIKPVVAYTDGDMQSAAYWLGSSAREVFSAKTAQIGSVGTLVVHTEYSKALAEAGQKKTIVRYGKYKAAANPFEPLSADGEAQLQALVDQSGKIFVEYVASRRGVSAEQFQETMGEGRVFLGQAAKKAGLVDGVMNLQEVMHHMKTLDNSKPANQNSRNPGRTRTMKAAFSKKTILAIAAGAAIDALGLDAPEANSEGVKLEGDALVAFKAEASEVKAVFDAATQPLIGAAVTAATAPLTAQVTELTATVAALTAKVTATEQAASVAQAAAVQLTGQLSASAEMAAKQAEIVKASCSVMSVALGGRADAAAALTGDALLSEHERLKVAFAAKFPTGGVAAVQILPNKPVEGASQPPSAFLSLMKTPAA